MLENGARRTYYFDSNRQFFLPTAHPRERVRAMRDLGLIGRDKELKALTDRIGEFLDAGRKRQALWLHVFGEDGIGKTRLIEELLFSIRSTQGLHCLKVRDFPVSQLPYGAVSSALCNELGIQFWESEYSKKEKLESRLAALGALKLPASIFDPKTLLPVFGQLLGINYPLEFATGIPRRGKGKLLVFNAVLRYLQALRAGVGESHPELTVIWFDDLDRTDRLSLELLVHLVQKKESLWPLLILSSSVSSFSGRLDYLEEFHEFSLGRLSRLSQKKIMANLELVSGAGALPSQLQKTLIEGTPGNPRLLLEIYHLLSEKTGDPGVRERKKSILAALESKSRALELIDLLRVMRERLRPLDSRRRSVLQAVAVLGPYCCLELLSGLLARTGSGAENLLETLESLVADEYLQSAGGSSGDGSIRLSCGLAYEVLLEGLPGDRLTTLRQQCAELFHSLSEEDGRDLDFASAGLLAESYFLKLDWAVGLLESSGDRLMLLEDYPGALRAYDEAIARLSLELAEPGGEPLTESLGRLILLQVKSGKARLGAGLSKEAFGVLGSALQLARGGAITPARVEACLELGEIMLLRGDWSGAERFFEEGREAAQQSTASELMARCLIAEATLKLKREDYPAARRLFEEALEGDSGAGAADRKLEILLGLGLVSQQTGQYKLALEQYGQALSLARERQDDSAAVTSLSNLGRIKFEQEQVEEALELFHQALESLRGSGDLQQTGNWLGYIGTVYFAMAEYETAIDYYRQALSLARRTGSLRNQGIWLANLGNAHYEIKEIAKALEFYLRALEFAREDQDYSYVSTLLSTIGVYYYNLRQYDMAQRYFNESLPLAREIGNYPIVAQNILYRGEIAGCLGDEPAAALALNEGEALSAEYGLDEHRAVAELFRAHASLRQNQPDQARGHCRKALEIAAPTGNRKLSAEIERALSACKGRKKSRK